MDKFKSILFGFLPQIAKALVPPITVGLVWVASHVPGVEAPPVGMSEWLASLVVGAVVYFVPNAPKPTISG